MAEPIEIPLMAEPAACGFPSPAEQYVDSALNLNELLVKHPAATYFVRAAGNSMNGAGILPGDILVVDRTLDVFDGAIVIACVDNEFTVKYFRKDEYGIRLEPADPAYPTIRFSGESELRLFGIVTACIHQFQRHG